MLTNICTNDVLYLCRIHERLPLCFDTRGQFKLKMAFIVLSSLEFFAGKQAVAPISFEILKNVSFCSGLRVLTTTNNI